MAKVQTKNLRVVQGSHYKHVFTVTKEDGTLYPLNGFSARMQIRASIDAATTLFENAALVVTEVSSEVTVEFPAATSAAWSATDFAEAVYDIEVVLGTFVKRIVKGKISLDPEVTR